MGVLPLQTAGREGRAARLLDDHGSRADGRPVRGSAGGVAAVARGSGRVRRAAYLRISSLDHVLAEGVLLLRAPETAIPRSVRLSATHDHGAADPAGDPVVEVEGGPS